MAMDKSSQRRRQQGPWTRVAGEGGQGSGTPGRRTAPAASQDAPRRGRPACLSQWPDHSKHHRWLVQGQLEPHAVGSGWCPPAVDMRQAALGPTLYCAIALSESGQRVPDGRKQREASPTESGTPRHSDRVGAEPSAGTKSRKQQNHSSVSTPLRE